MPSKWVAPALVFLPIVSALLPAASWAGPMTQDLTIQPIDVCSDTGTNCALPAGAVPAIFQQATFDIWAQAGIVPTFLPVNLLDATAFQNLNQSTADSNCSVVGTSFPQFCDLSRNPGHGQNANPSTINAYFVNSLITGGTPAFGFAWTGTNGGGGNGVVISADDITANRIDTLAHEIGHNFGLDHTTFGAGGAADLMTAGTSRTIPSSLSQIVTQGGTLDVLDSAQIGHVDTSPLLTGIPLVTVTKGNGNDCGETSGDPTLVQCLTVDFVSGPAGVTLTSLSVLNPHLSAAEEVSVIVSATGIPLSDVLLSGQPPATESTADPSVVTFGGGATFGIGDTFQIASLNFPIDQPPAPISFSYQFSDGFVGIGALDQNGISTSQDLFDSSFVGEPTDGFGRDIPQGTVIEGDPAPVPEPSTLFLLLGGLAIIAASRATVSCKIRRLQAFAYDG